MAKIHKFVSIFAKTNSKQTKFMKQVHLCSRLTMKILLIATTTLIVFACNKDLYVPPTDTEDGKIGEVTLDNYFNYATTKSVQLNINYGKECSQAYFEVYAENPLEVKENQVVRRKDLVAVASGFTDENGVYNKPATITASVTKVYIYSPDFGVPTLYITDIVNNTISAEITYDNEFDISTMVNSQASTTRGASKSDITANIPNVLGIWSNGGRPNYLVDDKKINVTEKLKKYITTYFEENQNNTNSFITDDADLVVQKNANVWINYFGGETGAQSTFAYYCYDENATPEQIKNAAKNACVIFPSAHANALGRYSGVAVKLMYFANGEQTDVFPAGTKIGFLLWNNGWTGGNGGAFADNVFYSTASLNRDKRSHTAVFGAQDGDKKFNVITMEDWTDSDYNDVAFVIQSNPVEAIVVPPAAEPGDRKGTDIYRGLLCFEDNWPKQGDYDMNDVVLKYVSNVDYNFSNNVIGITDKFTLTWTGANFKNGFAYEVPYDLSIATVDVIGAKNYSVNGNVITLFTDAKAELGVDNIPAEEMPGHVIKEASYTVSIKFNTPSISKEKIVAPYNPFIKRNNTETHLTDKKTSPFADNVFDQLYADISDGKSTFFVCKDGYPFAIHLDARTDASILNINLTEEGKRIDEVYPLFSKWAKDRNSSVKWWKK